jgi:hypothetical protein
MRNFTKINILLLFFAIILLLWWCTKQNAITDAIVTVPILDGWTGQWVLDEEKMKQWSRFFRNTDWSTESGSYINNMREWVWLFEYKWQSSSWLYKNNLEEGEWRIKTVQWDLFIKNYSWWNLHWLYTQINNKNEVIQSWMYQLWIKEGIWQEIWMMWSLSKWEYINWEKQGKWMHIFPSSNRISSWQFIDNQYLGMYEVWEYQNSYRTWEWIFYWWPGYKTIKNYKQDRLHGIYQNFKDWILISEWNYNFWEKVWKRMERDDSWINYNNYDE